MTQKEIEKICEEYVFRYRRRVGKEVSLEEMDGLVRKAIKLATKNYQELKEPKTCGLRDYVDNYVREELLADFIYKTYPKKNISDPTQTDPLAIAVNKYLKILPLGAQFSYAYLWNGIYKMLKKKNEDYMQKLYYPFLTKAEKPYVKIVKTRNQLSQKQGYKTFVEFHLSETTKISPKEYQSFLKNKDKVIKFCQKQIPKIKTPSWFYSQFNNGPCFLCQLSTFPKIDFPNGVIDFVAKEYPNLKKFQHKIKIKNGDRVYTEYIKKTDSFVIGLNKKLNKRHQVTGLIHELSHVVAILKNFSILSQGKYQNELEATKIELKLLKKLSPELYGEKIASMLIGLYQTSFEIEAHKNSDQDLPILYAKIINRCLPRSKQTKNYTYLINENFITHPLRNLPHAMAYVKLISDKDNSC